MFLLDAALRVLLIDDHGGGNLNVEIGVVEAPALSSKNCTDWAFETAVTNSNVAAKSHFCVIKITFERINGLINRKIVPDGTVLFGGQVSDVFIINVFIIHFK